MVELITIKQRLSGARFFSWPWPRIQRIIILLFFCGRDGVVIITHKRHHHEFETIPLCTYTYCDLYSDSKKIKIKTRGFLPTLHFTCHTRVKSVRRLPPTWARRTRISGRVTRRDCKWTPLSRRFSVVTTLRRVIKYVFATVFAKTVFPPSPGVHYCNL